MKQQALRAMERDLRVILDEAAGAGTPNALAEVWRGAHEDVMRAAQARKGVPPAFVVAVDNDRSKAPEAAQRIIVSLYDYRREIVTATIDALDRASPRRSGDYIRAHTIFVNGSPVGKVCPPLAEADKVFVANPVPYARRLEIGRTKSGRPFVIQVPPRIYERVAKTEILVKYRNLVRIKFQYVDLSGAHVIKGGLSPAYAAEGEFRGVGPGKRVMRKRRQKVGEAIRFPAIYIEALG